jgi:hypothetical protein
LVSFDLTSVTSDGTGTSEGDFTTQFNESYLSLLSTLGSGGTSPTETCSATFTVDTDPAPVPEPGSIATTLAGLGLVVLSSRKAAATKQFSDHPDLRYINRAMNNAASK